MVRLYCRLLDLVKSSLVRDWLDFFSRNICCRKNTFCKSMLSTCFQFKFVEFLALIFCRSSWWFASPSPTRLSTPTTECVTFTLFNFVHSKVFFLTLLFKDRVQNARVSPSISQLGLGHCPFSNLRVGVEAVSGKSHIGILIWLTSLIRAQSFVGVVINDAIWRTKVEIDMSWGGAFWLWNSMFLHVFNEKHMHRLRGTDADPYDPNRGMLYRYIGWYLMHKTPKMIEASGAGRWDENIKARCCWYGATNQQLTVWEVPFYWSDLNEVAEIRFEYRWVNVPTHNRTISFLIASSRRHDPWMFLTSYKIRQGLEGLHRPIFCGEHG